MSRRSPESDDFDPLSYAEEESADLRRDYIRQTVRWTLAFAGLFAVVFFAFWWSGSAVRFSASRIADRGAATWRVTGVVRNASTRQPVPWATIDDDSSGRPPFFHAEADQNGSFELVTLPESHRIRIGAPGYRPGTATVGRAWFLWLPKGQERLDLELSPE